MPAVSSVTSALVRWFIDAVTTADITSFRRELSTILLGPERPVVMAITENPYRGLRSFEQGDADDFFGRDRFVEQLAARLGRGGVAAEFVAKGTVGFFLT